MIDIERLASEAGFIVYNGCCDGITADLKRFSAMVRNEVLEEAAKVCEGMHEEDGPHAYAWVIRSLKDKT